jgi:PPP family 3-phenylpropionic acid transporter
VQANRLRLFFFCSFVSYGAFLPFFPTWLEARGVRGVAMSALMALGPALGVLGPPGFGALSDWLGLRAGLLRVVTAGGLAATLLLAVPGALGHAPALPLLFVAMLLFSTSRAPAVAMADVITIEATRAPGPDGEAPTYGGIRLWGSIGFLVAAAAVGRVLDVRALAALPLFLLAAALVTFALSFTIDAAAPSRARHIGAPLARLLRERPFAMLLVSAFVGFGAHASYDICFSLHLQRLGAGADQVGVAWAIGTLAETGLMAVSGRLLARVPASRLLVVAFAVGALRWALIATVRDVPVLLALQPLHAVSFALFWVTSIDHVRQLAPGQILATAQGVFNAAVGGGAVLGMFVWGATFEAYGGPVTFACAAGAAGCAALAAAWTGPPPRASGAELL